MNTAHVNELIVAAIPFFFVFMVVEYFFGRHRAHPVYEKKDTFASLAMGVGNVVFAVAIDLIILAALAVVFQFRLFEMPTDAWWSWVLAIVVFDFLFYWMHRMHHEVRVFWAAHVNHHSSEKFNYSTALRQSWTEPLTALPFWLPMALMGFSPAMVLFAHTVDLLYQFLVHTELVKRMGPIEWVFNTPSHHRVHHGSNLRYLDKNYAGILIIWDRMFGTFEPESDEEEVIFGLTTNIDTYNPIRIAFHEWVAVFKDAFRRKGVMNRIRTFTRPPGWDPDGKTLTVPELRALEERDAAIPESKLPPEHA